MADYAISNVPRRVVYAASGTGPYAFTFEILNQTDIAVYKASTLLTLTTDYTVTINANGTGSVTLVTSAGTSNITIVGAKNIQRTTDFTTGGDLFANTLNDELDNQTIFIQQVAETAERGLKAPVVDPTDINMTLPAKASRVGTVLAFNATTGNPEAGPSIGSVTTVAAQSANINTVATNIGSVNTVAGNITNVNTVAGVSSNVTTVASNIANVNAVGADLLEGTSEINTVAVDIANVNTVGTNIASVNTVAGEIGAGQDVTVVAANLSGTNTIGTVATNIANVNATGTNIANVNAVGADLLEAVSEINTVATDITNVNTVGANIGSVNTVAGISSNVSTVAGISANVTSVAGNSTNINAVAGNSTNINAVASNATSINAVNSNASNINTVAGISSNVTTVATNNANVTTVATNIASVNTCATDIAQIITTANDLNEAVSEIEVCANNIANINTVGTNISNVNTVAGISSNVTIAATNVADINNFADVYQGAKATDPTLRNDGSALQSGDLYFNTTDDVMKVREAGAWLAAFASLSGALIAANNLSDLTNNSTARTNLGLGTAATTASTDYATAAQGTKADSALQPAAIGVSVQAFDAQLADIAALTPTDNTFIVGNGTNFASEDASTARSSLGLGSIATQAANNVAITGGSISGITDLSVADGGTGSSSLAANNVLLGNGTSALQTVAPSTSGNVLTSNGTTWNSAALPAASITSATAVAGTGISVTGITTTGAATHTITNTGVTSAVAGSGISVSGSTGAVTISASPAAGSVLQVVQTTNTTRSATSCVNGGTDLPGMSVNITPSSSSNKILVLINIAFNAPENENLVGMLLRNGTKINQNTSGPGVAGFFGIATANDGNFHMWSASGAFLDSPGTTSAITYKLQGGGCNGTRTLYLNGTGRNSSTDATGSSTIIAMEIKG